MPIKSILKSPNSKSKNKNVHFRLPRKSSVSKQKLKKILSDKKTKDTLNKVWSSKNPQKKFESAVKRIASNSKK